MEDSNPSGNPVNREDLDIRAIHTVTIDGQEWTTLGLYLDEIYIPSEIQTVAEQIVFPHSVKKHRLVKTNIEEGLYQLQVLPGEITDEDWESYLFSQEIVEEAEDQIREIEENNKNKK